MQIAHFRKTTLTLKNRDEGAAIRRYPMRKLKNEDVASRYRHALKNTWAVVKDIGYESAADRYKDYSWAISQAAAQILKPARRRQNFPYYVTRHKREAMMSHNLFRNYETQGN